MLGAIYTGLSGLNAFSKGLQTISNNVSNMNTLGYKASTATFSDVFSSGGPGLTFTNASDSSVGNGVAFNDSLVDFGQGELRQTGRDLDLAIQGSGFLVLVNQGKTYYARTGQFSVDKDGYISLQGNSDFHLAALDATGKAVEIQVDTKRTDSPKATTSVTFADNLSSSANTATVADIPVYDSLGGKLTWQAKFDKDTTGLNQWTVTISDQNGNKIGTQVLKFIGANVDPSTAKLTFSTKPGGGADPLDVTLDFSGVNSFSAGAASTLRTSAVDGNAVGSLASITVDENGKLQLSYSNGQKRTGDAIALADFRDPQELERVSGGMFADHGTGPVRLVAAGSEGAGKVLGRQLEASNTDLTQQFGQLILIQRGFQASSQVVSASNDMIQQLFGIRGQG
jgi:flagellar hook protein FlgE